LNGFESPSIDATGLAETKHVAQNKRETRMAINCFCIMEFWREIEKKTEWLFYRQQSLIFIRYRVSW